MNNKDLEDLEDSKVEKIDNNTLQVTTPHKMHIDVWHRSSSHLVEFLRNPSICHMIRIS